MEVIAKKKSVIVFYSILALIGLTGVVLGIVFFDLRQYEYFLIIVTSAALAVTYTVMCVRYIFSVCTITYDGEKLDFGNGLMESPSQILSVECNNYYLTRRPDVWGSLTVRVGDVTIKYPCIARVGEAGKRLLELKNNNLTNKTEN